LTTFSVIYPWVILKQSYGTFYLILQGFVATAIVLIIWKENRGIKNKMKNGIGGPEASGGGQFGTSRWQTEKERDANNSVWKYEKEPIKTAGIVLGADLKKKKVWLVSEDEHTLIIGTTGSGKTRRIIYPAIWTLAKAGESMILTDPKGELYAATKKFLEEQGYEVIMLDFRKPKASTHHWNPIKAVVDALKEDDESKASEAAWNIANMIVYQKERTGDPVWATGAESVIAALILYIAIESKKDSQKHMASVFQLLVEYGVVKKREIGDGMMEEYVPLLELIESLERGHLAKLAFATAGMAPEKMRGSFFASVAADLRLFADPSIAYMTSFQDHDLKQPGEKKTATFLIIPDEVKTRHFLATLYIDQTYFELVNLANSRPEGRIAIRTSCLLDEFGNMPRISDFDTKITVSRSRGVRYNIVVQGLDQIKEKYGKLANTITGNCRVWLYLLTGDNETAEVISKKLGTYTVATDGYSATTRTKDFSASYSQNLSKRELLTPDEVMRFPDFEAIVIRQRQYATRVPTPDISKYPIKFIPIERGDLEKKDIRFDVFDPFKAQWEGELEAIEKANKTNDLEETAETEEFEETMDITNEPIDVAEQKESYMDII
ncbi:VirD4-like conjugal transfer protein, CD1115 family, partial [Bacillus thuringiensis]